MSTNDLTPRQLRDMRELFLLRQIEKAARAGHQPMKVGPADHKWHVSGCDVCVFDDELDQLRRAA